MPVSVSASVASIRCTSAGELSLSKATVASREVMVSPESERMDSRGAVVRSGERYARVLREESNLVDFFPEDRIPLCRCGSGRVSECRRGPY